MTKLQSVVKNTILSLSTVGALSSCGPDQNPVAFQQDVDKIRQVVKQELNAQGVQASDGEVQKTIVAVRTEQCMLPSQGSQGIEGCMSYGTAPEGCTFVALEGCGLSYGTAPEGCAFVMPEGCTFMMSPEGCRL